MDTLIRILTPAFNIALPLALGVFLARRFKVEWRLFGIGALTFIASQVLHLPFNAWVLTPTLERFGVSPAAGPVVLLAFAFGLSAGLFEETARYLVYRFLLKGDRGWRQGVMFGAGHGGVEALLVGLLGLWTLIQVTALQGVDLNTIMSAEEAELASRQIAAYQSAPWHLILLGAVERVGAVMAHLGLAVLVLQSFVRRNRLWLLAAILWHALLNALALITLDAAGPYWTEVVVVSFGLVSLGFIWLLRPGAGQESEAMPGAASRPPVRVLDPAPTEQEIEDSRYV